MYRSQSGTNGEDPSRTEPQSSFKSNLLEPCKYGDRCFRKNPVHFEQFSHPVTSSNLRPIEPTVGTMGPNHYGFYLFRVPGLKYHNLPTVTLNEILSARNGELIKSIQFNYMFDIPWLVGQYPEEFRSRPLTIVHGFQTVQKEILEKQAAPFDHVHLYQAQIRISYGTHHTKMMIMKYKDGLKIIIHTANMIKDDWSQRTQGIWMSPKLECFSEKSDSSTDSPTNFRRDLITYMEAYNENQSHASLSEWIDLLYLHDFRPIKVLLVASVSGRHVGDAMKRFGHTRMRELLKDVNQRTPSNWPVIGQFSSIGSLGKQPTQWFTTEWSSSMAGIGARGLRMIYPTVDNVRNSLEGYMAGGCLPYAKKTAKQQAWLKQFLHSWQAFGHSRAIPHIKSYTRISPNCEQLAWFLLTSANLSKAAWGVFEKCGQQLMIRSYELGVLFLPTNYADSCQTFRLLKCGNKRSHSPVEGLPAFPVPYELPAIQYEASDEPWIVDESYQLPDVYGNLWKPVV